MKLKGFTLIETLIYIALLGLLLTGAVATSYQLVSSAALVDTKNTANEEGSFVLRKIDWALSGAQTITAPTGWGSALSVTRYDGTTVDMRLTGTAVEMRENSGAYVPITTGNVRVSSLSIHNIAASSGAPAGVEASTTISGVVFYTVRYVRK